MVQDGEEMVREWIASARTSGMNDENIKREMINGGYTAEVVDRLLLESPREKNPRKYMIYLIGAIALIVIVAVIILLLSGVKKCTTDECFIAAANKCQSVTMDRSIEGSIYGLSEKNCVLTKSMKQISATEPSGIATLLGSKSMVCPYNKGSFDKNLIGTVSMGMENCTGDLKNSLEELIDSV